MEARRENEQGRKGRERKGKGGRIRVNWKEGINCAVKINEKGGTGRKGRRLTKKRRKCEEEKERKGEEKTRKGGK